MSTATSNYQICPMPELFHQKRLHFLMFFKHSNSFFEWKPPILRDCPNPVGMMFQHVHFTLHRKPCIKQIRPPRRDSLAARDTDRSVRRAQLQLGGKDFRTEQGLRCFAQFADRPKITQMNRFDFPNLGTHASRSWNHGSPV